MTQNINDKNSLWTNICSDQALNIDSGACALFEEEQVAIFKFAGNNKLYALSNFDPFGQANVISRGIVGSIGNTLVVSSPLYKQHFCLETGQCLEDENVKLKTFAIRSHEGQVQLRQSAAA